MRIAKLLLHMLSWLISFHIYNVHGKLNSLPFDLLVVPHGAPWLAFKCIVLWTGLVDFAEPTHKCVCAFVRDLQSSVRRKKGDSSAEASLTRGAQKLVLVLTLKING